MLLLTNTIGRLFTQAPVFFMAVACWGQLAEEGQRRMSVGDFAGSHTEVFWSVTKTFKCEPVPQPRVTVLKSET